MEEINKVAEIIYEATRIEAIYSGRPIVPEVWNKRSKKFRKQFVEVIESYLQVDILPSPEEAHNSWMESYYKMGWKYGKKRDPIKKTHPDLIPYKKLPKDERDKDAIFLTFIWLLRKIKEVK